MNWFSEQVGGRKFGKFTAQPMVNNIKIANWGIQDWQISLICQICQTKVPPQFRLLR